MRRRTYNVGNVRCLISCGVVLCLLATALAAAAQAGQSASQSTGQSQASSSGLTIVAPASQTIAAGENFSLTLAAQGGILPYTWSRVEGDLPPGLRLHPHTGVLSGAPTTPGEYHFSLAVGDSSIPQLQAQRALTIIVVAGLTMDWKQPPTVQDNTISGSLVVSNQSAHTFDITVIVVAVNSIGRATALGYQHFTLAAQQSSPEIPFSASPGMGSYVVRADAAAHRKNGHHIFRASKQTAGKLEVTQF